MTIKKNKRPLGLYIKDYVVFKKNQNKDTRLEYIYRYAYDNAWKSFLAYAQSKSVKVDIADKLFIISIIDVKERIDKNKIEIKYKGEKKDDFLSYLADIRTKKLMFYLGDNIPENVPDFSQRRNSENDKSSVDKNKPEENQDRDNENPKEDKNKKEQPVCLYISNIEAFNGIQNKSTRFEYIYRYIYDNDWKIFLKYAFSRGADKDTADKIFTNAVILIKEKIDANQVELKYNRNKKDGFLSFVAKIRKNKLMGFLGRRIPVDDVPNSSIGKISINNDVIGERIGIEKNLDQNLENQEKDSKKKKNKDVFNIGKSKINTVNEARKVGDTAQADWERMHNLDGIDPDDIMEYIYDNKLSESEIGHFHTFFIKKLTLKLVAEMGLMHYEDFLTEEEYEGFKKADKSVQLKMLEKLKKRRYNVAKTNKNKTKKKLEKEWINLVNNEHFLDNMRFKKRNGS